MLMKRLNYVARNYYPDSPGGCEKVFYELYKRAKKEYNIRIISSYENKNNFPENSSIFPKKFKHNKLLRYIYYTINLTKKSLEKDCDLIHANNIECIRLTNKPFILNVHHISHFINPEIRKQNLFNKLMKQVIKIQCNRASKVISVSNKTKKDLIRIGVEEERIKVIPNGVDLKTFKPVKKKEEDKFIITQPSRISPEKGQKFSIKALNKLPKRIKERIELRIIGYVSNESFYKSLPKKKWIKYYTNLKEEEFAEKLARSDLIIFPTFMTEGFGLVVLEGMACGVPVIASKQEAIKEAGGSACQYFKQGSEEDFLKKIKKVYNNKPLREKMKKKGLERVKSFTWSEVYKSYKKLYTELIKE